jgi:hypothetical protein
MAFTWSPTTIRSMRRMSFSGATSERPLNFFERCQRARLTSRQRKNAEQADMSASPLVAFAET